MSKLIGTNPNQVPSNADLGSMAYQNNDSVVVNGGSVSPDSLGINKIGSYVKPTMLLDFANSKMIGPNVEFTRTSGAYYYGDETMISQENLISRSQEFTKGSWSNGRNTLTINRTVKAPDGTYTATNNTQSTTTDGAYLRTDDMNQDAALGCYSFYVKYDNHRYINLTTNATSRYITFDLLNASVVYTSTTFSNYGINYINDDGWMRIWVSDYEALDTPHMYLTGTTSGLGNTTSAGANVIIWGAQLEYNRTRPTAYLPTFGRPANRYMPIMSQVSNNIPRFERDTVTGESKGLLIESATTNTVSNSTNFSGWNISGASLETDELAVAPDGTHTAQLFFETAGNSEKILYDGNTNLNTNQVLILSAFMKMSSSGHRYMALRANGSSTGAIAVFDLQEGVVTDTHTTGNYTISETRCIDVGGGWFRCALICKDNGDAYRGMRIQFSSSGKPTYTSLPTISYTSNQLNSVYVWGAMFAVETTGGTGSAWGLTSYIGGQSTRSADLAIMDLKPSTTTNVSNKNIRFPGTLYTESISNHNQKTAFIAELSSQGSYSSGVNRFYHIQRVDQGTSSTVWSRSQSIDALDSSNKIGQTYKAASRFEYGDWAVYNNGEKIGSNDQYQFYANVDSMRIGSGSGSVYFLNGHIRKIAWYPEPLDDSSLKRITEVDE